MLWIEGVVALVIAAGFVLHAFFVFKPEHVEHHPTRVRIGAGIQGLTIGLLLGFFVIPLRLQYMDVLNARAAPGLSTLSFMPAFFMLIAVRRGVLLKAPVLSTYLRAYRRAGLLKARDDATRALAKLDAIEGRRTA